MTISSTRSSSFSTVSSTSSSLNISPPPDPRVLRQTSISYEYSTSVALQIWIRSSSRLLHHGKSYLKEGILDEAFVLYLRYIDLFVNKLYRHPDLKYIKIEYLQHKDSPNGKLYQEYLRLKLKLPEVMSEVEKIQSVLKESYDSYQESEGRKRQLIELQDMKFRQLKEQQEKESIQKKKEEQRRKSSNHSDDYELSKKLRSLSNSSLSSLESRGKIALPTYPKVPEFAVEEDDHHLLPKTPSHPPILPPHPQLSKSKPSSFSSATHLHAPNHISSLTSAFQQQQLQQQNINHKTVNFTEGGAPLRTLFLPSELTSRFLKIAETNTSRKLETCGILLGKLNRNAFFINYLLIPEQDSTANTCTTKNEEKMFEFIDEKDPDLFILGWIHTHPTQSCFLSSVDLHTQNSYQIMLNEAIAIVCSPDEKFNKKLGIFRLTDPPGVPTITNCSGKGFHPHNEDNLYTECNRIGGKDAKTGHVVIMKGLPFNVEDMREKK